MNKNPIQSKLLKFNASSMTLQAIKNPSVLRDTWSVTQPFLSETIMNIKPILIKTTLALMLSGCFAQAESLDQPQVNIAAKHYEVESISCHQICVATVKADDYSIYIEYRLDDASVEFLDIVNVIQFDRVVNAYVDRYEIEKINTAIAGGAK